MLDVDYQTRLGQLIQATDWKIELPAEWHDFFEERGPISSHSLDKRRHQRMRVRAAGLLWFDEPLPAFPRPAGPIGIYTRDLSRQGLGIVAPLQLYPEEKIRVLLPTFWVELRAVRSRRITATCYVVEAQLIAHHEPSASAFDVPPAAPRKTA